jgi:P27 family predicted phage terminase small subunit
MQRGAKPTPTRLKLLKGTDRADRLNRSEPSPQPSIPRCPAELGEEARKEWKRITKDLHVLGLLTSIDRAALSLYCDAWGRWIESLDSLKKYGVVIKSPNGYPVQSPYLAVANKAAEQVRLLLGEFGLSPASRARVHAAPKTNEAESKWSGLL